MGSIGLRETHPGSRDTSYYGKPLRRSEGVEDAPISSSAKGNVQARRLRAIGVIERQTVELGMSSLNESSKTSSEKVGKFYEPT